ncbi:MAG: DUF5666 domain-containing protein [Anaerolineae bacterium]
MLRKTKFFVIAALSLVMLLGVVGAAAADESRPLEGRRSARGVITEINGESLVIETLQQGEQLIVHTSDETRYRIVGQEEAGLGDFQVGDTILVRGQRQEDGSLMANLIVRQPEGDIVIGRITAVSEDSLLLNNRDGQEVTVSVSADTIVVIGDQEFPWGGEPAGYELLHEGERLLAFGDASEDGQSMTAHTLVVHRSRPQRRGLAGQIVEIGEDSFTMTPFHGATITVLVTDETRYRLPGVETPDLSDFSSGDHIIVGGRMSGENEFTAQLVSIMPEHRPPGRPVLGTILRIDGDEFMLETRGGQVLTVKTGPDTQFRIGRSTDATLADFSANDRVAVFGSRDEEHSDKLMATHVMKRR